MEESGDGNGPVLIECGAAQVAMSRGLTQKAPSSWVPQVLLLFIILLVAASFAVLGVQWQEELLSLHLSLQVSSRLISSAWVGAVAWGQSQDLSGSLVPQDCK